jgi:hypothetical protein
LINARPVAMPVIRMPVRYGLHLKKSNCRQGEKYPGLTPKSKSGVLATVLVDYNIWHDYGKHPKFCKYFSITFSWIRATAASAFAKGSAQAVFS